MAEKKEGIQGFQVTVRAPYAFAMRQPSRCFEDEPLHAPRGTPISGVGAVQKAGDAR